MASFPLLFSKENAAHETIALSNAAPSETPDSLENGEAPEISPSTSTSSPSSSSSSTAQEGTQKAVLALQAPPHPTSEDAGKVPQVEIEKAEAGVAGGVFKFDALGPMVVNSNGTLSRITNWEQLSEGERERTVRLLVKKRNLVRMAAQSDSPSPPSTPPLPSPSLSQDPSVAPSNLPPPTAPPSHLPLRSPASSTSNSSQPPYPFQSPEIEARPHSELPTSSSSGSKSSHHNEKEGVQGATGTMVDPHGSGQMGSRGIEEKIVDLMREVEQDAKGEAGSGAGEGEVKAEEGSGEGRSVKVVSLGETDIEKLR